MSSMQEKPSSQPISSIVATSIEEYQVGGVVPAGEIEALYSHLTSKLEFDPNEEISVNSFPLLIQEKLEESTRHEARNLMHWALDTGIVPFTEREGPKGKLVRKIKRGQADVIAGAFDEWKASVEDRDNLKTKVKKSGKVLERLRGKDLYAQLLESGSENTLISVFQAPFILAEGLDVKPDVAKSLIHLAIKTGIAPVDNKFNKSEMHEGRLTLGGIRFLVDYYKGEKTKVESGQEGLGQLENITATEEIDVYDQEELVDIKPMRNTGTQEVPESGESGFAKRLRMLQRGALKNLELTMSERLMYEQIIAENHASHYGAPKIPDELRVAILEEYDEEKLENLYREYMKPGGHDLDFDLEIDRITVMAVRYVAFKANDLADKSFMTNPHSFNSMLFATDLGVTLDVMRKRFPNSRATLADIYREVSSEAVRKKKAKSE